MAVDVWAIKRWNRLEQAGRERSEAPWDMREGNPERLIGDKPGAPEKEAE